MKKTYTAAFKVQVVLDLLKETTSVNQLATEHGVAPTVLREWRQAALTGMPDLFERRDSVTELKAAHERERPSALCRDWSLNHACQFSEKKALTLTHAERAGLVERTEEALPLRTQADLLGLSRASLYYQPVPPSPEEVAIKHRIDTLYTAHPFYGSRKVTVILNEEGVLINRKRVQRYMREMGIAGITPGPNLSKRAV